MSTVRQILEDPNSFVTSLIALLVDQYGAEALRWAPTTQIMELTQDFSADLPQVNRDKLSAGSVLLTTDLFYHSLPDHIMLCNVLGGSEASFEVFDPADLYEEAWGLTEAALLAPIEDGVEFSPEICGYIGKLADEAGLLTLPDVLRIALRDADPVRQVNFDYSDDPAMFNAIYDVEKAKVTDIELFVQGNMAALLDQIEQLPLINGNPKEAVARLRKALSAHAAS